MKITNKTMLNYDYFSDEVILLNGVNCFYYEKCGVLDRYQILEHGTDRLIVCSETKEELIDYLISQEAEIK